ncbi:hypothetical protein [Caulobacter sp. LARHSG274]
MAFDAQRDAHPVALAGDNAVDSPSPAAALQRRLIVEFDRSERISGRWSPRRTAAFIVGFNGVFWVAAALVFLLHA